MPGIETEFTEYHSPDGQVYRFDNRIDRFLLSETGYGMPPIDYLSRRGPQQHGDTIYDYRLTRRLIQLIERENACSREEYYAHRATILDILRPNRQAVGEFEMGILRKALPDGSLRDINVLVEEGPIFAARDISVWDEWAFTEAIRFVAPDPTFFDPDQKSAIFALVLTGQLYFPFSFGGISLVFSDGVIDADQNVTYNGTWHTYPLITITGPIGGVIIENETTGEIIRMNYGISVGRTVTIDLSYGRKTVTDDLGNNLIGVVSTDSDLATFHIAPSPEAVGGVNTLSVKGVEAQAGASAVTISYYERYIGF